MEFSPMVVDPNSYDRSLHWDYGLRLVGELVGRNKLRAPSVDQNNRIKNYGICYHRGPGQIQVNYTACRNPVKVPVRSWSFPGYKADLSVAGVTVHETGHAVDHQMGRPSSSSAWRRVLREEARVSGYEPNPMEAFAEAFRLFGCNPDLLRTGRPQRWRFFTEELRLNPAFDLAWGEVLRLSHSSFTTAAQSWIAQGKPQPAGEVIADVTVTDEPGGRTTVQGCYRTMALIYPKLSNRGFRYDEKNRLWYIPTADLTPRKRANLTALVQPYLAP